MSKILITGNGFDLFHHLPTKYGHFMSIMRTIEKNKFNKEVPFEELFGDCFKGDFISDYDLIGDNYKVENISFDFNKINGLKVLLNDNLWHKYFKTVIEIETWIDFEGEVENVLKQLSILLKFETPQFKKTNNYKEVPINYSDFSLFGIIEHKYDDKEVFSISEKYINKRNGSIDIKNILNDLATSFENFVVIFNRYLIDVVTFFYAEIKQKAVIPFNLMNEIYTFNYTPSLENIYSIDKSKMVYLHGKMHEDNEKQNLVFGVSEIPQEVKETKAYDFAKYYQRIKKNSNRKFIEIPINKKSVFDETIFYIIGHSLDESDKEYISDLFKFLEFDLSAKSKICVFYHNTHDREHKLKNLFNIIDKNVVIEMNKVGRLYFVELDIENINREFNREIFIAGESFFVF